MDNLAFGQGKAAIQDVEQLAQLIGEIYDAVLDPALWPPVLAKVSAFVGGVSGALYAKDAARRALDIYHHDNGIDPIYVKSYFDTYVRFDPSTTAHFTAEVGQVITVADIMPWAEFLDTRFYREWVRPQGMGDSVNAVLDKSANSVALFGVFLGGARPADQAVLRRMNLILPHMRRAVLIGRIINFKTAEAAAFGHMLDGLKAATFFVAASGAIMPMSRARNCCARARCCARRVAGLLPTTRRRIWRCAMSWPRRRAAMPRSASPAYPYRCCQLRAKTMSRMCCP